MSDLDLTEAVEAAARGSYEAAPGEGPAWESLPAIYRHEVRDIALGFVTHAAPLIEAQVRAQIVADIESDMDYDVLRNATLATAARIARGGS